MCRRISLVVAWACLLLLPALSLSCSLEEAERIVVKGKTYIEASSAYVPKTHTYIPAGLSALATATLCVIKLLKERRNTKRMKEAIKAKARQIGTVLAKPSNPDAGKENPRNAFMRGN